MNTTYFLNLVAGNVFGSKKTPGLPNTYYVGLSKTPANVDGSGVTEPSASHGYARTAVNGSELSVPSNGVVVNTSAINFNESTADWGVIQYYVIYDAQTGGNLLMYGSLSAQRQVEAGTVMTIKEGSLRLSAVNTAAT